MDVDANTVGEYAMAAPVAENLIHSTIDWFITRPIVSIIEQRLKEEIDDEIVNEFTAGVRKMLPLSRTVVFATCALIETTPIGFPESPRDDVKATLRDYFAATFMTATKVR